MGHGVVCVGDSENSGLQTDFPFFQPFRIPAAIPAFVMFQYSPGQMGKIRDSAENSEADLRMAFHFPPLLRRQFPFFIEHFFINADLANIMQQAHGLQPVDLMGIQRHGPADRPAYFADPTGMLFFPGILLVQRPNNQMNCIVAHTVAFRKFVPIHVVFRFLEHILHFPANRHLGGPTERSGQNDQLFFLSQNSLRNPVDDPFRLRSFCSGQQQDEFIAADPGHDVVLPAYFLQNRRQFAQKIIAGRMAKRIIGEFQTVHIGDHQRQRQIAVR